MKRLLWILVTIAALFIAGWVATPLSRPIFPEDYSTVVVDREGRRLRVFLNTAEQWCFPPDTAEVPEKLVISALTYEDKRFFRHFGIDPIAFFRATGQNLRARRVVSGASTITMQVARIANPKQRSIFNKFIEAYHSLKIELRYSKEEILRLYFEHAPYGGNIRGYRAACLRYWGIEAEHITWGEAATLAVLPNSPALINPDTDPGRLKAKRDKLLRKLHDKGHIDDETLELSLLEPIPAGQIPYEFTAPHLTRRLAARFPGKYIHSTIDRNIQREMERLASHHA
jgi:penicillin-binding protein 1C